MFRCNLLNDLWAIDFAQKVGEAIGSVPGTSLL